MKHPTLLQCSLITLGNHTYRGSYYSQYNTLGWKKHRKKCLDYLGIKARSNSVGIGYIESIDDFKDNRIEEIRLVRKEFAGYYDESRNMSIFLGEIENNIKCVFTVDEHNSIWDLYISEDSITAQQIKALK